MAELIGRYTGPLLDAEGKPLTDKYSRRPCTIASGKYIRVGQELFVDLRELPAHLGIALNVKGLEEKLQQLRDDDPSVVEGGNFRLDSNAQPPSIALYGSSDWLEHDMYFPRPSRETERETEEVWERLNPGYTIRRRDRE